MNKKKLMLIASVFLMTFLLTGCKVAKLENGQDLVVNLKGDLGISADTLYEELKFQHGISTLINLIDTKILNKEFKTDDAETAQVQFQIDSWLTTFKTEENLLKQTEASYGISNMKALRVYLALQYKRTRAVDAYVKSLITDKEVKDYYKDRVFGDTKASHILIGVEEKGTLEEQIKEEQKAKKKAEDIILKLNSGADFKELAKNNSTDTASAIQGGSLGEFSYGKMVDEFEVALIKLKVGEYTKKPIKTKFGYHIILKEAEKDKPKLETIEADIKEKLANAKRVADQTLEVTALEKLREKYNIKFEDTEMKNQYEIYMRNKKASLK